MVSMPIVNHHLGLRDRNIRSTNARLSREVRVDLRRSGYAEMRDVEVAVEDELITLMGVVSSFHLKQLAQEIARQTVPTATIDNRLTVVSPRLKPR